MKYISLLCITVLIFSTIANAQDENSTAKIAWDKWGVPHITADNVEGLFYAQGWAQMHNHANLILDLYGTARGKGAEYWGETHLQDDILIHTLGFSELADKWESEQDPETKIMAEAFIKGMNAFAKSHPEQIEVKNRVVLPLTIKDMNMHLMTVVFTRFVAGKDLGRSQRWGDMGSNTYAIAPSRSASGNAMLVQNPHLPWSREFLFFESHLMLEARNMYGTTLVGLPGIAIGFNNNLGWSHTNNTIDNADVYELSVKEDKYLMDGVQKNFEVSAKTIQIRQEDGTLLPHGILIMKTDHGPVVGKKDDKVLSLRMTGLDRPNMQLQWWRMINSTNFDEFEAALKMSQLPFWNVMYADKEGDIFYLFNGLIPKRSTGNWEYWDRIIPGGKSTDIWSEVHTYTDLPKIKNPENGWLQNANDPPWTSTIPMILDPGDFPEYMAPKFMHFRPQRAARMMIDDESITFNELVEYKLSTRVEFADRILDDLFEAVDQSGSADAKAAKVVLEKWDREADADSKGMILFNSWADKFGVRKRSNYVKPWDISAPHTTPDGLADPENAVQLLEEAAAEVKSKFGRLDPQWGDYYRINYNKRDLPANGYDGELGIFRVAWPGDGDEDHMYVGGGDSWVGIIEFGEEVNAKVLLSYGNATQKDSPHNGDQLELFSKKLMRDAWFTKAEVEANTVAVNVFLQKDYRSMKD